MKHRIVINTVFFLMSAFVAVSCFVGCSKGGGGVSTEYVEGTVHLNGTPVETAQVTFYPKEAQSGMPATGYTDASGKFKLTAAKGDAGKGTLSGEYVVTVTKITWLTERQMFEGKEQDVPVKEVSHIPQIYAAEKTTPLTATVEAGKKNTFSFDLKGTP